MSRISSETTYCPDLGFSDAAAARTSSIPIDPEVYDDPTYTREVKGSVASTSLLLRGINCAACGYKIEQGLREMAGVNSVWVNFAARRLKIEFDSNQVQLSEIIKCVRKLGYDATPWQPTKARQQIDRERRDGLKRLGITAVLGMQVMTIAVALYFANASGIDPDLRHFLTLTALLLTTPVLVYGARPFYSNALRAIRAGRPDMDLTVCMAITLAFIGSLAATFSGYGDTYFESICMFVFLLTGARLIETTIRQHASQVVDQLANATPQVGLRVNTIGETEGSTLSSREIRPGDLLFVTQGESFAADGVIVKGDSAVNEALLTGESTLRPRAIGDPVLAGSVNARDPLWIRVERTAELSTLSRIGQLADRAQTEKPQHAAITDPIAAYFIVGVLIIATITALAWLIIDPSQSLGVTIAVLAVACPCALSLAAPAAFSAAADTLIKHRVLPTRAGVINAMQKTTDVVFDKTGTLTLPTIALDKIHSLDSMSEAQCLAIAQSLEHSLSHPIAHALRAADQPNHHQVEDLETAGQGVSGTIAGTRWRLGHLSYVSQGEPTQSLQQLNEDLPEVGCWLTKDANPVAAFTFVESVRPDSTTLINTLKQHGLRIHLLSGDYPAKVEQLASSLGIDSVVSQATPATKLDYVRRLQESGCHVAMIGDGVNDSPALAKAEVSVAVDSASPLAAVNADLVILGSSLTPLGHAFVLAKRTHKIVKQNLYWALIYNTLSIPLAAVGLVPAWLAATGMSLSSIIVVTNALRLRVTT